MLRVYDKYRQTDRGSSFSSFLSDESETVSRKQSNESIERGDSMDSTHSVQSPP